MGRTTIAVGMIGSSARAALWLALGALTLGAAVATRHAFAQQPATDDTAQPLSADALADLVGPIALYPDDLVGIVLPASTYPLQVVQAARFLDERAKNPSLKPNDVWDDSVVALLNYPEVVKLMNDDLDWTWKLGDAVISQRADVLDAIQGFRTRAAAAGNLRSDDRQVVANDGGAIAIKPADPEVIYVPYYEPERVVVYQSAPVYHYYPYAYPVYYYPYPYGYAFNSGFFWGVTSAYLIGWNTHYVNVYHCGYYGHPYYGHQYNNAYYVRRDANVSMSRGGYVWEPHYRRGAQPFTRSDGQRYVGTRGDQGDGASQGSYRGGAASARAVSSTISRSIRAPQRPVTARCPARRRGPTAAAERIARAAHCRTIPQRDAALVDSTQRLSGAVPGGRQQNQPIRNRDPNQSYRSAPPPSADSQAGAAVRRKETRPWHARRGSTARAAECRRRCGSPSLEWWLHRFESRRRRRRQSAAASRPAAATAVAASIGANARRRRGRKATTPSSSGGGIRAASSPAASSYRGGGGGGGESRSRRRPEHESTGSRRALIASAICADVQCDQGAELERERVGPLDRVENLRVLRRISRRRLAHVRVALRVNLGVVGRLGRGKDLAQRRHRLRHVEIEQPLDELAERDLEPRAELRDLHRLQVDQVDQRKPQRVQAA